MRNKKKILLILLVVATVLLAGCVQNGTETATNNTKDNISTAPPDSTPEPDTGIIKSNISSEIVDNSGTGDSGSDDGEPSEVSTNLSASADTNKSGANNTANSASWCKPGAKVVFNDREYTVIGLVEPINNKEICQSDIQGQDQKIVHLFSEDGSISNESVVSTGRNATAKAISIAVGPRNSTSSKSQSGWIR